MIQVFKTNVSCSSDAVILKPLFDKCLADTVWNFDLEDCDKILRVESQTEISEIVINLLQDNGYECEELDD